VKGPLVIGDGRFLGLGLMAPVPSLVPSAHAFAIVDGLNGDPQALDVSRALRRAVMARVQSIIGEHAKLAPFFSGHAEDRAPIRRDHSSHLAFAFEPVSRSLLVLAPHLLERRTPTRDELGYLHILDDALDGFRELRAGAAGRLTLLPSVLNEEHDGSHFGRSQEWETVTPYVVSRHVKEISASEALAVDVRAECRRLSLPEPRVESRDVRGVPGIGLVGEVRLSFGQAVSGPILLGRSRYFGGGLFRPLQMQHKP
jgi:CRISPR-associated protein Csb2